MRKTGIRIFYLENRIFIIAIFLSILWHLLWISIIKVVVKPAGRESVKFSKVAFLGPVSAISTGEIKAAPKSISFLEKRYRDNLNDMPNKNVITASDAGAYGRIRQEGEGGDDSITYQIRETLEGVKIEPAP